MAAVNLRVADETATPGVAKALNDNLLDTLRSSQPQATNSRLTLSIRDDAGVIIAGLVGATSYGWLHVDVIWVAEAFRGQGLGRRLMDKATQIASDRGCHGVWLDTSSDDAAAAYLAMGFVRFGRLVNGPNQHPTDHQRSFLSMQIPCPHQAPANYAGP